MWEYFCLQEGDAKVIEYSLHLNMRTIAGFHMDFKVGPKHSSGEFNKVRIGG